MKYNFEDVRTDNDGVYVYSSDGRYRADFRHDYPIEEWDSPEAFSHVGIKGYEPMTAKELDTDEKQDEAFNDPDNYIEEKFDGTRGIMQFLRYSDVEGSSYGYARIFSRRISKKTGFYVENSDSLPQLKLTDDVLLDGTVIDGEMFIDGRPFKDVSSTLNCLWDKAIDRQLEKGFITLHAFDIIKYKGVDLRRMKLEKRKVFLKRVIQQANNPYITSVPYFRCGETLRWDHGKNASYSGILRLRGIPDDFSFSEDKYAALALAKRTQVMTPRAYYELIVATGGEGVIIKSRNGKYKHKRGWEYSKIKKFLTREMILIRFDEPTREYEGKAPENWGYWIDTDEGRIPVTKHYYNKQVGNLVLGVIIHKDDYNAIPKNKRGEVVKVTDVLDLGEGQFQLNATEFYVMEVCECGGFDDATREFFTRNRKNLIGSVVEVRANEIMRDSGRLRHPRYERMRNDKEPLRCTWDDHIA